jgi:hypothetical protein
VQIRTTDEHGNPKPEIRNPKQIQNEGNEKRIKTKPETCAARNNAIQPRMNTDTHGSEARTAVFPGWMRLPIGEEQPKPEFASVNPCSSVVEFCQDFGFSNLDSSVVALLASFRLAPLAEAAVS